MSEENWKDRDPDSIRRRHARRQSDLRCRQDSDEGRVRSVPGRTAGADEPRTRTRRLPEERRPSPSTRRMPEGGSPSRYARSSYRGKSSEAGPQRLRAEVRPSSDLARSHRTSARDVAGAAADVREPGRKRRHPVRNTVLVVLLVGVVAVGWWMHVLDENMHIDDPALDRATTGVATPFSPYYLHITGPDARADETARTDTIMLCRVDPVRKKIALVSIPRDTRVDIEGHGMSKINAAYAYGGPSLTVSTVSGFADDTAIAHYYQVGFEGFAGIVDAVGGVTVDVPENTEVYGESIPSGTQTLNGEQALIFVRCRDTYALGDFQRAANQRQLVVALMKKMKSAPPWRWPAILTSISKCIGTDAWAWQNFLILLETAGIGSDDVYTAQVPSSTRTIDGVSYVVTDQDGWGTMLARLRAGQDPSS